MAVPLVDSIRWSNYQHRSLYPPNRRYIGIFEWGFLYKETYKVDEYETSLKFFTRPYP